MSATIARPTTQEPSHWYYPTGEPCYEVLRSDGQGMRPTTLADARKLGLWPSVTTINDCRRKPQLEAWKIENAVLAAVTTPKRLRETLDEYLERVLHTERHQDQESDKAKARGTQIHDAMEKLFKGMSLTEDNEIAPWVMPAFEAVSKFGGVIDTEHCFAVHGYGGRCDLVQEVDEEISPKRMVWDWKTAKRIPDKPYDEHRLQIAAYAMALGCERGGNVYISTTNCGEFKIVEHSGIVDCFHRGFQPLFEHWQWTNNYFVK